MDSSTKNQAEGKLHEMKGALKEKAGEVLDDPELNAEGQDEKVTGTVQKKAGEVQKVFGK